MGRKRKPNNRSVYAEDITKTLLRSPTPPLLRRDPLPTPTTDLVLAQLDRRAFRPDASVRPPGAIQRKNARLRETKTNRITFAQPNRIAICARRKQRKQVLFAKRLTGRGARRSRKRNFWSNVKC